MVGSGEGSAFLTPIVWLFIAMLVSVPLLAIVRATVVDGTLDWGIGIALFLGLMCGAGMVLASGGAGFAVVAGIVLMLACGAWPVVSKYGDRKIVKKLRDDDVERFESAIQFDPSNAGAHAGLAEKWAELGQIENAIDEYRIAIRLMPDGPATKRWKTQLRTILDKQQGIDRYDFAVCRNCDKEIPKKTKTCPHCGAVHHMNFLEWAAKPENLLPALRDGFCVMIVLVFAVFALLHLPSVVAGAILAVAALVGGWFLLQRMAP